MADKSIGELIEATSIGSQDLFVLEQGGQAKSLTGQVFVNWLTNYADGHGGINSITGPTTVGLVDTYTIVFADTSTTQFSVSNGKALTGITQYFAASTSDSTTPSSWSITRQTMTPTNKYLWSYFTFAFNDGTAISTPSSVIGVYGDTGAQTYVWIKYSTVQPTDDRDMGDSPDEWIGVYSGSESDVNNLHYTDFAWYQYKGEKGEVGEPSEITFREVKYANWNSGTVIPPDNEWSTTIPSVSQGNFLWSRTVLVFNGDTLNPLTFYSVSRYGVDGAGSVSTVNNVSPDANGNITLSASNILTTNSTSIQTDLDNLEDLAKGRVGNITLDDANWTGNNPWTQYITLQGETITANTKVDLQASATALAQLQSDDVYDIFATNSNGTITVFARGKYPPRSDVTLQYLLTETTRTGNIAVIGDAITVGASNFYELDETEFTENENVISNVYIANGMISNGWIMFSFSFQLGAAVSKNTRYKLFDISSDLIPKMGRTYREFQVAHNSGAIMSILVNTWDASEITLSSNAAIAADYGVTFSIVFPVSYNALAEEEP